MTQIKEIKQALNNYASANGGLNARTAIVRQAANDAANQKDLQRARCIVNNLRNAGDLIGLEILAALGLFLIEDEERKEK